MEHNSELFDPENSLDKSDDDLFFDEADVELEEMDASGEMLITDEVVAIVAGMAAVEVEGVSGMSGGFAGGIVEAFGRKNLSKGVKVETLEEETSIDLYVIVKYGYRIPDLAWRIQEKVKESVESMTGITVSTVNIHVQGVDFSEPDQPDYALEESPMGSVELDGGTV